MCVDTLTPVRTIGHGAAGKTSLIAALRRLSVSTPPRRSPDSFEPPVSTEGIDTQELVLDKRIRFSVWDFAGQIEYTTTHGYFLSARNALYLVAVDVSLPWRVQCAHLEHWLSFIRSKLGIEAGSGAQSFTVMVCEC